jgi:hypothetical protein
MCQIEIGRLFTESRNEQNWEEHNVALSSILFGIAMVSPIYGKFAERTLR